MSKLTSVQRARLSSSAFAFPKTRSYPIHDINHANSALALGKRFLSSSKYIELKAKIKAKYGCKISSLCKTKVKK